MSLTEANTIQEYILKILQKNTSNLNWEYLPPDSITRKETDILLEKILIPVFPPLDTCSDARLL